MRIPFVLVSLVFSNVTFPNLPHLDMSFANEIKSKFGKLELNTNNVPHFKGENVKEREYFEQNKDLNFEGNLKAQNDKHGQYLIDSNNKRPRFNIDHNDPMLKNMGELTDNSHDLTKNFEGCKTVKDQQKFISETSFCYENGTKSNSFYNCTNSLEVSCTNAEAGMTSFLPKSLFSHAGDHPTNLGQSGNSVHFGTHHGGRNGRCRQFKNTINFNVDDLSKVKDFIISSIQYDDWASISVNGTKVFDDSYKTKGNIFTSCERSTHFQRGPVDIKRFLKSGQNIINTTNTVYGAGHLWFSIQNTLIERCLTRDIWTRTCDKNESNVFGKRIKNSCTDNSTTKMIKGTPVKRPCWNYIEKYSNQNNHQYTLDNTCKALVKQECGQISKECVQNENDFCKKWKVGYSCAKEDVNVAICAKDLPCPNGDCSKNHPNRTPRDASNDFKQSMSYFSLMKELSSEINHERLDTDDPVLFSGKAMKCKKQKFGFKNCCVKKGWGVDLGLTKCGAGEIELGMAREAKKTIRVGSYEESGNLYSAKYYVFCSYPSKLARILIENGKRLLGQNLGEARDPDCSGINIHDLEKIDFNQIDLSEIHQDMENVANKYNKPNIEKYIKTIKSKIENTKRSKK